MKVLIEQYIDVIIQMFAEIALFVFIGICASNFREVINGLFDAIMFR